MNENNIDQDFYELEELIKRSIPIQLENEKTTIRIRKSDKKLFINYKKAIEEILGIKISIPDTFMILFILPFLNNSQNSNININSTDIFLQNYLKNLKINLNSFNEIRELEKELKHHIKQIFTLLTILDTTLLDNWIKGDKNQIFYNYKKYISPNKIDELLELLKQNQNKYSTNKKTILDQLKEEINCYKIKFEILTKIYNPYFRL